MLLLLYNFTISLAFYMLIAQFNRYFRPIMYSIFKASKTLHTQSQTLSTQIAEGLKLSKTPRNIMIIKRKKGGKSGIWNLKNGSPPPPLSTVPFALLQGELSFVTLLLLILHICFLFFFFKLLLKYYRSGVWL